MRVVPGADDAARRPMLRLRPGTLVAYAVLIIYAIQSVYPAIWMVLGSLKEREDLYRNTWGLPERVAIENYAAAWRQAELGTSLLNSAIVTAGGLLILLIVAIPAAYALARLSLPGGFIVFVLFLIPMLIPPETTGLPLFMIVRTIGLLDSKIGLMLVYATATLPIALIILRAFFVSLPRDMEEAAEIDGAGRLRTLVSIAIPLARPGIATVAIFQGMWMWNEYFLALLMMRSEENATISLGLVRFIGMFQTDWVEMFAALTIVTIPVVVLFVVLQRQFIAGLTTAASK